MENLRFIKRTCSFLQQGLGVHIYAQPSTSFLLQYQYTYVSVFQVVDPTSVREELLSSNSIKQSTALHSVPVHSTFIPWDKIQRPLHAPFSSSGTFSENHLPWREEWYREIHQDCQNTPPVIQQCGDDENPSSSDSQQETFQAVPLRRYLSIV